MNGRNLTADAQRIYDLVCTTGAITVSQANKVLGANKQNGKSIISGLCGARYVKWIAETYVTPFYVSTVNKNAIYCLHVALDLLSDEDGNIQEEKLSQITECSGVVEFSYIQNNSAVINMVYLDENDNAKIPASVQRFYDFSGVAKGEEKTAGVIYMFVTSSEKMLLKLKDSNLAFPHKIAFLSGDIENAPDIRYL